MSLSTERAGNSSRWDRVRRDIGRHMALSLFEQISRQPLMRPNKRSIPWTPSLLAAWLLAMTVHLSALGFAALCLVLLLQPWNNLLLPLGAVMAGLMCVLARPRRNEAPDYPLSPSDYPALHALADRIAASMQAPAPDALAVSAEFNANYRSAGWRQTRHLELGAPLMAALSGQERVALMAHEIAHGANGDPMRGQVLHGAIHSLHAWASGLRPLSLGEAGAGTGSGPLGSLLALPLELLMLACSECILALARALWMLTLRASQSAEYLADRLGAQIAGVAAMRSMLERLYLQDEVEFAVQAHALNPRGSGGAELGAALRAAVQAIPAERLQAYREESRATLWQSDTSHPPTELRIDMLNAQPPIAPPLVQLTEQEASAIEAEVQRLLAHREREMVNLKLAAIHG